MKDEIVRAVAALILSRNHAEAVIARNPSIPNYLLADDFKDQLGFIVFVKERIVAHRWRKLIDTCYLKMFSSHEAYVTFVMSACIHEHERNQNVFESFMSVNALLCFIRFEALKKIRVNLSYLNPFIFMQFYRVVFVDVISRQGGGLRLLQFIRCHRYLNYNFREFVFPEDAINLDEAEKNLNKQIEKELKENGVVEEEIDAEKIANDESCRSMAKEVLKCCTGMEHASLPSREEVVKRLVEYRKMERKVLETAEKSAASYPNSNVHLDKGSNSITESKTKDASKYHDNIEQYETIIQAVIRYNHSKSSGRDNANTKIQEEANGVLQHLKETIEKLTKVLTEFDKD